MMITFVSCNNTDGGRPFKSDVEIFKNPFITGEITNINWRHIGRDSLFTILVEENPAVHEPLEKGGNKIRFSLSESTEIFIQKKSKSLNPYHKEKLKVGQKVGGWTAGVVVDSYPLQGSAKRIVVIE